MAFIFENDPEYQQLDPQSKDEFRSKFFDQVVSKDPDYAGLNPVEQAKVHAQFATPSLPEPTLTDTASQINQMPLPGMVGRGIGAIQKATNYLRSGDLGSQIAQHTPLSPETAARISQGVGTLANLSPTGGNNEMLGAAVAPAAIEGLTALKSTAGDALNAVGRGISTVKNKVVGPQVLPRIMSAMTKTPVPVIQEAISSEVNPFSNAVKPPTGELIQPTMSEFMQKSSQEYKPLLDSLGKDVEAVGTKVQVLSKGASVMDPIVIKSMIDSQFINPVDKTPYNTPLLTAVRSIVNTALDASHGKLDFSTLINMKRRLNYLGSFSDLNGVKILDGPVVGKAKDAFASLMTTIDTAATNFAAKYGVKEFKPVNTDFSKASDAVSTLNERLFHTSNPEEALTHIVSEGKNTVYKDVMNKSKLLENANPTMSALGNPVKGVPFWDKAKSSALVNSLEAYHRTPMNQNPGGLSNILRIAARPATEALRVPYQLISNAPKAVSSGSDALLNVLNKLVGNK